MLLTYQGLYTNTCGSGGSRLPAIGVQLRDRFVNIGPSNLGSANQPALQVNRSFLISLKQEVTISGLGVEGFEAAVNGMLVIYQGFQHVFQL